MRQEHGARPRAWFRAGDAEPGSGAQQQLTCIDAFVEGSCTAPDLVRGRYRARSLSMDRGERVRGALQELYDRVFMLVEDYAQPEFREPGDLSDPELPAAVRAVRDGPRDSPSGG
jgi:hypothetical protein